MACGWGSGVALLSLMWPGASCFSPLYLLTASSICLPSYCLSFPHKLPSSGDSVISSCSYFWGRTGSNGLGHKGCLYCWCSLSASRSMGLSPQNIPEPFPLLGRSSKVSAPPQSCAPHFQPSPTFWGAVLVLNLESACWSLQTLSLPPFFFSITWVCT